MAAIKIRLTFPFIKKKLQLYNGSAEPHLPLHNIGYHSSETVNHLCHIYTQNIHNPIYVTMNEYKKTKQFI